LKLFYVFYFFYCNNLIETNKTKTSKGSVSTKPTQNSIFQNVVSIYRFLIDTFLYNFHTIYNPNKCSYCWLWLFIFVSINSKSSI